MVVQGQLWVEEVLDYLINVVISALPTIKFLSNAQFFCLKRDVDVLLFLFESLTRDGSVLDLHLPSFEEHFPPADSEDIQDIPRKHN